jgi:hypothetical protein
MVVAKNKTAQMRQRKRPSGEEVFTGVKKGGLIFNKAAMGANVPDAFV